MTYQAKTSHPANPPNPTLGVFVNSFVWLFTGVVHRWAYSGQKFGGYKLGHNYAKYFGQCVVLEGCQGYLGTKGELVRRIYFMEGLVHTQQGIFNFWPDNLFDFGIISLRAQGASREKKKVISVFSICFFLKLKGLLFGKGFVT